MVAILLLALGLVPGKSLNWTPDSAGRHNVELWLDPYRTTVDVARSLTDAPLAKLVADGERATVWWMFEHLRLPRDVLVEVGANPLPVAGWAVRKWARGPYDDATYGKTNFVQAVVRGFPEPWAVSLLVGNVVGLVSGADTGRVNGMGYTGFLVGWGAWSLSENRMIRDDWIEAGVKMKGDDIRPSRRMGWSLRAGWREHFHPEIRDAIYGSIVRRRTDFKYKGWYPLRNSSFEVRIEIDKASLEDFPRVDFLRWSAVVGKKFPFAERKMAWEVKAGVVRELHPQYTGSLETRSERGWKLVLRPNLEW